MCKLDKDYVPEQSGEAVQSWLHLHWPSSNSHSPFKLHWKSSEHTNATKIVIRLLTLWEQIYLRFYIFVLTCTVSFGIPSRCTLTFSLRASALVIAIRCCLAHKLWNQYCIWFQWTFWFNLFMSWSSKNIAASMSMSTDISNTEKIDYLSNLPFDPS